MSYDLTGLPISSSFDNIIQITGSDNRLYDLKGNTVGGLRYGNATNNSHAVTGSLSISGSLNVHGQTILDSQDSSLASLVVKGKTEYITQQINIQSTPQKPQLTIEGLGTVSSTDLIGVIDLGEGFNF